MMITMGVNGQSEKEPEKEEPKVETETEEVNGVFEMFGYLGKKLAKEVGNRMNLEEDEEETDEKKEETYKRVKIKIGPIKIERLDRT